MKAWENTIEAKARSRSSGGKFQADLTPSEVLNEDAVAEQWAASAAMSLVQAKTALASLECFITESLGKGWQLNFKLVSFYPRLSGALSTKDADPTAEALYVRGAVKARRPLMECAKDKLKAVNAAAPGDTPAIFSILDKDTGKGDSFAPGHVLSAVGFGLAFDPSRDDEGVWLEQRSKKQGVVQAAKARMLKIENGHLEFVFDAPVERGKYLVAVYTRSGKGTDYKVVRTCRQMKAL